MICKVPCSFWKGISDVAAPRDEQDLLQHFSVTSRAPSAQGVQRGLQMAKTSQRGNGKRNYYLRVLHCLCFHATSVAVEYCCTTQPHTHKKDNKRNDYFYRSQELVRTSHSIKQLRLPAGRPRSTSLKDYPGKPGPYPASLQHHDSG